MEFLRGFTEPFKVILNIPFRKLLRGFIDEMVAKINSKEFGVFCATAILSIMGLLLMHLVLSD